MLTAAAAKRFRATQARRQALAAEGLNRLLDHLAAQKYRMVDFFDQIDLNGDSELDGPEFRAIMEQVGLQLPEPDLLAILAELDKDGDGSVSLAEFFERMRMLQRRRRAAEPPSLPAPSCLDDLEFNLLWHVDGRPFMVGGLGPGIGSGKTSMLPSERAADVVGKPFSSTGGDWNGGDAAEQRKPPQLRRISAAQAALPRPQSRADALRATHRPQSAEAETRLRPRRSRWVDALRASHPLMRRGTAGQQPSDASRLSRLSTVRHPKK